MAVKTLAAVTVKGIRGDLQERVSGAPDWWKKHCKEVKSNAAIEPYGWLGAIPQPREMVDGRRIKEMRAITYNIENKEYELSVLIPRKWVEDDQTGAIQMRINEMGTAWAALKPTLFNYMIEQGGTLLGYDGNTFFDDTREEGASGAIDNNLTSVAAADNAVPTASEFLSQMAVIKAAMSRYLDDEGGLANAMAMTKVRVIAPPEAERSVREALHSTLIDNTDNVYGRGLAELDINPFSTASGTTCTIYVHAVGEPIKGMFYQSRLPLEILIYNEPHWIDANNGVLVTLRERFVFAYGQFRRMVKHVFTT